MSKFFETPSVLWLVPILGGLTILAVTAYKDDSFIFHWPVIGPFLLHLNSNYRWLLQLTFVGAIIIHLLEGYHAYHLAVLLNLSTSDVIKWTIQTALYGFPSLHIIHNRYKETKYK